MSNRSLLLGSNPCQALFGLRLTDVQAAPAPQSLSKNRHRLLRDVDASSQLLIPRLRRAVGSAPLASPSGVSWTLAVGSPQPPRANHASSMDCRE